MSRSSHSPDAYTRDHRGEIKSGARYRPPGASLFLLRFNRIAGFFPRLESTQQSPDFFESVVSQCPRHTGAGRFVRSGAVNNDLLLLRQRVDLRIQLVQRNVDSALEPDRTAEIRTAGSGIDNQNRFLTVHLALEIPDRYQFVVGFLFLILSLCRARQ